MHLVAVHGLISEDERTKCEIAQKTHSILFRIASAVLFDEIERGYKMFWERRSRIRNCVASRCPNLLRLPSLE